MAAARCIKCGFCYYAGNLSSVCPNCYPYKEQKTVNNKDWTWAHYFCMFVCLVAIIPTILMLNNSAKESQDRLNKEKADVMREDGLSGSDEELAKTADNVRDNNWALQAKEAERRRILGD